MSFKIEDVPKDVLWVWGIQIACEMAKTGVGIETLNKCKSIMNDYPQWFPPDTKQELPVTQLNPSNQMNKDMSNEQIKKECDLIYETIRYAENKLKELRSICKHEDTFEGNYSYRIGAIERAIICSYCGTPVSFPERHFSQPQ
jgi:hypothetical protein